MQSLDLLSLSLSLCLPAAIPLLRNVLADQGAGGGGSKVFGCALLAAGDFCINVAGGSLREDGGKEGSF